MLTKGKLNFCTLFNSAYLSRGMVLYHSLIRHCKAFHLFVFAFDEATYAYLKQLNSPHLTPVSLREFEDEELLKVKPFRSAGEYCWTSTASTILYCIEKYQLSNCTYIDADMCFYNDPAVLMEEMGEKSVLITEHRYTAEYDQSAISGKYCVQFMCFKNTTEGMQVLRKWRQDCLNWCYARIEDGKFGDQKYLDTWTKEFKGVHELQHLGGGLAPWNIQQYSFSNEQGKITGTEKSTGKRFSPVFFHFHGLKFYKNQLLSLSGETYELSQHQRELFYFPYIRELLQQAQHIHLNNKNAFDANGASQEIKEKPLNFIYLLRQFIYDCRSSIKNINGKATRKRLLHYHYYSTHDFI